MRSHTEKHDYDWLGGWENGGNDKVLTDQLNRGGSNTITNNSLNRKKAKRYSTKENLHVLTEQSQIATLKQQVLKLDSDEYDLNVGARALKRIDARNKSQKVGNLLRVSKNSILNVKSKQENLQRQEKQEKQERKLGHGFRKKSLTRSDPRSVSEIRKLRDNLVKDWDDAKKCGSNVGSANSSRRAYINYSSKIENCTLNPKNRMMRLTFWDPLQSRMSFCSAPQTSKMRLINTLLKEKFPELF